jgi:hypothetical protein
VSVLLLLRRVVVQVIPLFKLFNKRLMVRVLILL